MPATTETDRFGNVVRELSAQNRLRALAVGSGSAAKSRELDSKGELAKCESNLYAGLLCKVEPAAQPGTGQPQLLVKKMLAYNQLGKVSYDGAGRQTSKTIEGGGKTIPKVETLYGSTNGLPTTERFSCGGCDTQAVTTTYDNLGRVASYEDADGNIAKTTYDFLGRPITQSDGKGSQTIRYDARRSTTWTPKGRRSTSPPRRAAGPPHPRGLRS